MTIEPTEPASNLPIEICALVIADEPYGRVVVDGAGFILHANPAAATLIGVPVEQLLGRFVLDFVIERDQELAANGVLEMQEAVPVEAEGIAMVFGLARPDGSVVHVEVGSQNYLDTDGLEVAVLRLRPFDSQFHLQRYFHSMLGADGTDADGLALVSSVDHLVQLASSALCSGWDGTCFATVVSHQVPAELCGGQPSPDGPEPPWATAMRTGATSWAPTADLPAPIREAATARGFAACWAVPVPPRGGRSCDAAIVVYRSVAGPPKLGHREGLDRASGAAALGFERAAHQQALLTAATYDALTGLPNRARFFAALHDEVNPPTAVLYLDLDGFKAVNDAHGHRLGDELLRAVAQRLDAAASEPTDLLARLGGDEFAVLVGKAQARAHVVDLAERLIASMAEPFAIDGRSIRVGVSVGIADHPDADGETLLDAADHALYAAKRDGRGTWSISDPTDP